MNVLDIPSLKKKYKKISQQHIFMLWIAWAECFYYHISMLHTSAWASMKQQRSNKLREVRKIFLSFSLNIERQKWERKFSLKSLLTSYFFALIMTEMENYFHICFKLFHCSTHITHWAKARKAVSSRDEEENFLFWQTSMYTKFTRLLASLVKCETTIG